MMSNEPRTIRINWTRLDGASLDGGFRLKQMIGADGVSATFRTMDGAVIKAYRASGEEAEGQLRLWQQARALQHPSLIRVLGSGKTELEGQEVIYVALESTDESVADALSERPLERNEATEIVRSVANALEYLHSLGFVHGSLSPETVYALGETVKLSPEGIKASGTNAGTEMYKAKYPAPEWLESVTPAADVWSLGATLYEALTQEDATQREESGRTVLPAPFQAIVQGALKPDPATRITLPKSKSLSIARPRRSPMSRQPRQRRRLRIFLRRQLLKRPRPPRRRDTRRQRATHTQPVGWLARKFLRREFQS